MTDTVVILTSGSSWTIPADWDNAANTIECIGGGGGGQTNSGGRAGGGAGAYSKSANVTLSGATVSFSVGAAGAAGAAGGDTWFGGSSFATSTVGAEGGKAGSSGTGGVGGLASNGFGSTRFDGGSGGNSGGGKGGGGGGGAAGPHGAGATGGNGGSYGGAGGGGADGGSVGAIGGSDGGAGGDNRSASGGGTGGHNANGGAGSTGGAGGGGDSRNSTSAAYAGGAGSKEDLWTDNSGGANDGLSVGPGSGGGGGGTNTESSSGGKGGTGGAASDYGGAGGGGGSSFLSTPGSSWAGKQGVIIITYTPSGGGGGGGGGGGTTSGGGIMRSAIFESGIFRSGIFGGGSVVAATAFIDTLTALGLTTNLALCLDAGDGDSYTSGAKWLDTSGNGYDFFLGDDGTSESSDPDFNGTADNLSSAEFFSFDGSQWLTYDSTNETWMTNMHKDSAAFTWAFWWYYKDGGGAFQDIVTTIGASPQTGIDIYTGRLFSADYLTLAVKNADADVLVKDTGYTPIPNKWNFMAVSVDEAGDAIVFQVNGDQDTQSCTYVSPSSGNAAGVLQIGTNDSGSYNLVADTGLAMVAAWSAAKSAAELMQVYQATRGRFGV